MKKKKKVAYSYVFLWEGTEVLHNCLNLPTNTVHDGLIIGLSVLLRAVPEISLRGGPYFFSDPSTKQSRITPIHPFREKIVDVPGVRIYIGTALRFEGC